MGLLVLFGGLSFATMATSAPISEQAKGHAPLHAHASPALYRLPAAPRAEIVPQSDLPDREGPVRSKERLPPMDDASVLVQTNRKQSRTSFGMRISGLSFDLDF